MHLAVVIPTLNAASQLPETLRCLGSSPQEVVIADGGSSDATIAVATSAGAFVIRTPRGRGVQLHAGVNATRAPWLLLLHADTNLSSGWEHAVREHITFRPECAGYFRFALRSTHRRARCLERLVNWRSRLLALPYGDQGLLIGRPLLEGIGGVRPLLLMEDVDLVQRIGRRRLTLLNATAFTSAARWERDGWTRRSLRNLLCLSLWKIGVPPHRIVPIYR